VVLCGQLYALAALSVVKDSRFSLGSSLRMGQIVDVTEMRKRSLSVLGIEYLSHIIQSAALLVPDAVMLNKFKFLN